MTDSQPRDQSFTCSDLFSFSLLYDFYSHGFLPLEDDSGDEDVVECCEILNTDPAEV